MFIHVGNNKNIRMSDIIGIFDMDNSTMSSVTRRFLNNKQKVLLVESVSNEIPKSFILYSDKEEYKICLSPLSSSSLRGRAEEFR